MRKKSRENKGITLIALVITIIVLIILAGVSISAFIGDNGIVTKARMGAQNYQNAALEEKELINSLLDNVGFDLKEEGGEKNTPTPPEPIPNSTLPTNTAVGKDITKEIEDHPENNYYNQNNPNFNAKLDLGEAINVRLKKIAALAVNPTADVSNFTVETTDTLITAIKWSETKPTDAQKVNYGNLAMTMASVLGESDDPTCFSTRRILSDIPIYAWYNTGDSSIYIWAGNEKTGQAVEVQLHPHSERMFEGMRELTNVSGFADKWKISNVENEKLGTVRYMFKNTKVTNFNSIGWDVHEWTNTIPYLETPGNNMFYQMCYGTPSNSHPTFRNSPGAWDSEGTFVTALIRVGDITVSNYGQYIDIGTNILDRTIGLSDGTTPVSDWRVFKKESNGVWLILSDYMPNSSFDVTSVGLEVSTNPSYGVKTSSERGVLISGLNSSNWNGLISGSDIVGISGVRVKGAFELEEWIRSWKDKGYTNINTGTLNMPNGIDGTNSEWYTTVTWGYYIYKDGENSTNTSVDVNSDTLGSQDTLYFPQNTDIDGAYGYRLASPSASGRVDVVSVWRGGNIGESSSHSNSVGVRPAVFLPSNIILNTSENAWKIVK